MALILIPDAGSSQQTGSPKSRYELVLPSRVLQPTPGIAADLRSRLQSELARGKPRHVYLQLERNLDAEQRARLEEQGVELLAHLGSYTWYAAVRDARTLDFRAPQQLERAPILGKVRWIGEIEARDKIQSGILEKGVGEYNRNADGTVDLRVIFFRDVAAERLGALAAEYGQVLGEPGLLNDVVVRMEESGILALAAEDEVQRIEEVGPPDVDHNDGAAATAGVAALWTPPYSLTGTNVQVGQWESGNPDSTHGDLTGRITTVENLGVSDHATHTAGTVAGDGSLSAGAGGAANQWRGMANQAAIFSYSTQVDNLEPEEHDGAINDAGKEIDVSTNSWGSSGNDYQSRSVKFDSVVRGVYGRRIPIIFSASNSNNVFNSVTQPGGTAKNTIVVGNVNSDDNSIATKSSWGPTDEGQTKPDVVAPGDQTAGDGATTSTVANLFLDAHLNPTIPDYIGDTGADGLDDYAYPYGVKTGTSMAAPVVSGIVALMLEQYRVSYFGATTVDDAPLPSTFKALLCHTATDLTVNPAAGGALVGPDYVYGYGLVDATGAVDSVRDRRFREGVLLSEGDEDSYEFETAGDEDELKVTLAWDDWEGVTGLVDILQNDLDLLLIDPTGTIYYTPWQLDSANPANPAVRNNWASEVAAAAGRDNLNVVEQILVDAPVAGIWTVKVKAKELPFPYQRYSVIAGDGPTQQLEGTVDIVQVLDRSGSMSGLASATSVDSKIVVLRSAADQFIQMMKPDVGNQLGLAQFNANVVAFDPLLGTDLQAFTSAHSADLSIAVAGIVAGGATSIGDGLDAALTQFTGAGVAGHDRVVLLVSDGKENSSLYIADVQAALVAEEVAVYPLGLGYGSGINETKLTDLAEATGGTFRITADDLIFRKFFIEVLAGAVDWSVIVDPVGELGPGETALVPVTVSADQTGASFTAYWEGEDDALELSLLPPAGVEIDPASLGPGGRYHEASRYAFYQLGFPRAGTWIGTWQMKIRRPPETQGSVRYSASAFAEGGTRLEAGFDRLLSFTGDEVLLSARLTRAGKAIPGARVRAFCGVPLVGAGNVLHEGKVKTGRRAQSARTDVTSQPPSTAGDSVSAVDYKLQLLNEQAGRDLLIRGTTEIPLPDDGRHDDGARDDGTYANRLSATQVPGSYTCRFVASGIPVRGGGTTTREWTRSLYNEVGIDPAHSVLDARLVSQTADGSSYQMTVVPKDRFGNYLGPGRAVTVAFSGQPPVDLKDNLDGTYSGTVVVPPGTAYPGGRLVVTVNGQQFATLNPPQPSPWSISFHAGVAEPQGAFGAGFGADASFMFDLEYRLRPRLGIVGLLGYSSFRSNIPGIDDIFFVSLSTNLKYRFRPDPLRPYMRLGVGAYWPDSGDVEPGANLALGLEYDYRGPVTLDFGIDYHMLFDPDVEFVTTQAGVLLRF